MAPRLQLEKAAWRWTDTVRPEEVTREHIETAYRVLLEPRNCKGNPNCLVGVGEHVWLGEIDENTFHNIDDPNCERRKKDTFVGLTNLGATCYVNTFVQVWFLNMELRRALYLYEDSSSVEKAEECIQEDKEYEPQSICEHLQYLFALLQNSNRRYIDPSGFIRALGLDTGQQQDAQEFSKLFMTLLENTLSKQKNPDVRNIIQDQFCGQYAYVTTCSHCGRESKLVSKFYELELNIQGHKQLTDCVTEFLKEEKLEGDNRYFCENCQSKQNATRKIRLVKLPPTLNLQLMRFVFDRQTGHKKKLNTYIAFSETLDMAPFVEPAGSNYTYELTAVLIHRGVSAYSGHYIAHVRDPHTSEWYKFNDEEIEKMEGKKLQLGIEEDLEPSKAIARKPKCAKGFHCSRNAYMLVYRLKTEKQQDVEFEVPGFLQKLVELDNCKFEEWCVEMSEMRRQSVDKGKAKHEEVKELYQRLPAGADEKYEFVPLEWLQKWLDESTPAKPIDNSKYQCAHGKLHPDKISHMKRISEFSADVFYQRYGGGPRLKADSLCEDCVVERCRVLRLKNQLNEDHKTIANLVKVNVNSDEGYWIGKGSLRRWRQLATEQLGQHEEEYEQGDLKVNGNTPNKEEILEEKREDDAEVAFNEDLVCQHGGLCLSESERRLISDTAWHKLKEYFPGAPEFKYNQEPCIQCKILEEEGEQHDALHRRMANEQKLALPNLFQDKNRPIGGAWPQETSELYIVSQMFVEEWRKFIRRPTKSGPVSSVGNGFLLCPHGGLMFSFSNMTKEDSKLIALLWPSEWNIIQKFFIVDHSIRITRRTVMTEENAERTVYVSSPELCPECREGLLCQQERDLREYAQATIYIHKVVDNKKVMKEAAPELNVSGSDPEDEREECRPDGENDPDFHQANGAAKRQKVSIQGQAASFQKQGIRRSTRHRKVRGEKALLVSANQTLKDLKIQIMHAFSVAPFDQNLSIDGRVLNDDCSTLGALGIVPESVIVLKADEPIADYSAMDDVMQVCMPEEGFKALGCGVPTYPANSRIVNGVDAAPYSWPWQVSLQVERSGKFQHNCGGSLITTCWVLTAAHCVDVPRTYRVVLGEHDRSVEEGAEQDFPINNDDVFLHPNWNSYCPECGYDIALLKLPADAQLNDKVQLGCLPPAGRTLYSNQQCFATGWGLLYAGGPQAIVLQQAVLPVVDHEQCTQPDWWGNLILPSLLCAGGYGKEACSSDSGGPLNCQAEDGRWYIDGIVSFGSARCGILKKPTVFTRVSLFTSWIDEVITNH